MTTQIQIPSSLANLSGHSKVIYRPTTMVLPESKPLSSDFRGAELYFIFNKDSSNNSSTRISYSNMSACNIEAIRMAPEAHVQNKWVLSGKSNNTFLLNTQAIFAADRTMHAADYTRPANAAAYKASYAAINYEYYKTGVLKKILDLSTTLYVNNKLPSYRGQIVYSDKLSTEQAVKNVYGGSSWEQLYFCFLAGHTTRGNSTANTSTKYGELAAREFSPVDYNALSNINKRGGEEYAELATKHIPAHSHKVKAEQASFSLEWKMGKAVTVTTYSSFAHNKTNLSSTNSYEAKEKSMGEIKATYTGETNISTEDNWGTISIASDIYNTGGSKITKTTHNNMPPFQTMYVWRRVS